MFLINERVKETVLDFSKGKVIWFHFDLLYYLYKMAQYNTLNVKLSNPQLNKLKSGIKNQTETALNLSSNLIRNCNDETNFPHELLITNTQVPKIRKAFANGSPGTIKVAKSQLSKTIQSEGIVTCDLAISGNIERVAKKE